MRRMRWSRRTAVAALVLCAPVTLSGCVVGTTRSGDGGGGVAFLFVLFPLLLFGFAASRAFGGRRRRTMPRRPSRDVSLPILRGELSVLADDVMRLEPQVVLNDAARDDYDAAAHRYRVAQAALDHSDEPVDLVRVQRVVDEASWLMSRARAILEGRRPPAPPERLRRTGHHGEPAIRLDDRDAPAYVGSPAPFRSGWFGGGAGLFGGLLLGSMLGGFGGWVAHDSVDELDDEIDDEGYGDGYDTSSDDGAFDGAFDDDVGGGGGDW
jgi:hypothetical protein